ncbi:LysR family transcriptional regulator ArgP [Psychromonas aquimarina]|uniref:LysR family transcriptional regulator ArgP n=1 Tax=Psychromonas aquimarina TaxID=444919 RepID=UPI0004056DF0|nr:LysR family transcriptional regulator ArgP [Psychromonas aquimarina]
MQGFDYKLLAALNAVIEQQSFELAAEKLCISQPAVSLRLKSLEEKLGQPVVIRGQPLTVTPAGEKLLSHYKMVQQLESDLLPSLSSDTPSKPIKISLAVNADSIATWFIDAMSPILKNNLVEMNLLIASGEHTLDKLRSGQAIGGVTNVEQPLPGYRSFKLGKMNYILVASREFKNRYFSMGVNKASLKMAPGITYDQKDNMHLHFIGKHFKLDSSEYYCHRVSSSEAFVDLAKRGLAYCLIPQLQIENELANGDLINICPQQQLIETLYWHSWVLVKGINKQISQEIVRYARQVLQN